MSDLLQTIKDQVSKEHGLYKWHDNIASHLWPEVCKRYAFEVAKASLKEASENAKAIIANEEHGMEYPYVSKGSITDESNIKL